MTDKKYTIAVAGTGYGGCGADKLTLTSWIPMRGQRG